MGFCAFIWTGQYRVDRKALGGERGESDPQRTSRRDLNSGHRECSYDVCRHTIHKAIGASDSVQVYIIGNNEVSFLITTKLNLRFSLVI